MAARWRMAPSFSVPAPWVEVNFVRICRMVRVFLFDFQVDFSGWTWKSTAKSAQNSMLE